MVKTKCLQIKSVTQAKKKRKDIGAIVSFLKTESSEYAHATLKEVTGTMSRNL